MERRNPFLLLDPAPLPPSGDRPLEICLLRGEAIESRHRVHVMVCDGDGETVFHWGEPSLQFFPRSSVKLIQATSWVREGLEKGHQLGNEELALACASHHGERRHVERVSAWLERLRLGEADLECGAHAPYHEASAADLIRAGKAPCQLHNNCSGKHAGLLTMCQAHGWETANYTSYDHPAQEALRAAFAQFGLQAAHAHWGIDGCGIPTYSFPLEGMARAMGLLADPRHLDADYRAATLRLNEAVAAQPGFVGGTDSFCTQVVTETEGRVFAKLGAEGVYGAWIPKAGLGLAMKVEDGHARAAEVAMAAVLRELGHPLNFFSPLVRRWTGEVVGQFVCA